MTEQPTTQQPSRSLPAMGSIRYDAQSDHLVISVQGAHGKVREIPVPRFRTTLSRIVWLTAEAREQIRELLDKPPTMEGDRPIEFQVIPGGHQPVWQRLQCMRMFNDSGELEQIVGLFCDVELERRLIGSLRILASQDAMTGLLNHDACVERMTQAIGENNGGVLMMMDIDDFKVVNDTNGHLQGDEVIKAFAQVLRELVPDSALVGRYGGDEFLVFLPGQPFCQSYEPLACRILEQVQRIAVPVLGSVRCSMGIALAQNGLETMYALLKRADYALYEAKHHGKGHYVVVQSGQTVHQVGAVSNCVKRPKHSNRTNELVGHLFTLLHGEADFDAGINAALAYIGQLLDVSRVYTFDVILDTQRVTNTYEWCNEGITPQIQNLQNVDLSVIQVDLVKNFEQDNLWVYNDFSCSLPALRQFLDEQHIRSMLHWAFRQNGKIVGLVGFDECKEYRTWGPSVFELLQCAGEVLAEWILNRRFQSALSVQELFDGLSSTSDYVYFYAYDLQRNVSHWSQAAADYFALPHDYKKGTLRMWLERIHPDDRPMYWDDVKAVYRRQAPRYRCQVRARNFQGEYVWLECNGSVLRTVQGDAQYLVGLVSRLDYQSKYDPNTKCLSMREFYLNSLDKGSTLLLLGIDRFRSINTELGYKGGNQVLRCLSQAIGDVTDKSTVYRMTGDEFLVVMPSLSECDVKSCFERICARFIRLCSLKKVWKKPSVSGGAVRVESLFYEKEEVIRQLESALEQAKTQGIGSFSCFSELIKAQQQRRFTLKGELSSAVEQSCQGFELYYQPIEAAEGRYYAVEALLRFHSPTLGLVSPVEFIPLLEQSREIRAVGLWVMHQAVHQKALWHARWPELLVSWNVSYLQLDTHAYIEDLLQTVAREGVNPRELVVELTESARVEYPETLSVQLQRLKQQGFNVWLDDFGMENSSFALVRDLPVTGIKVDHTFVRTLSDEMTQADEANRAIISSIHCLGSQLNLNVIVEGVETLKVASIVQAMGVRYLQGYYFSKPVPLAAIELLLEQACTLAPPSAQ